MAKRLISDIEEIGLSEKESRVYLALLEHGSATADELAKASGLNRSTTYVQIEKLMSDGLISKFKEGKKTKFNAESPLNITQLLKDQEEEFRAKQTKVKSLIPELMSLYGAAGERPIVRYFEGIGGLRSLREEILKVKSKEYFAAASIDAMKKIFDLDELNRFSQRREQKKITVYLMYTQATKQKEVAIGNQNLLYVDPKKYPFHADVYIYDNTVSFAVTTGKIGGVIIESKPIAETMKSVFKMSWQNLS